MRVAVDVTCPQCGTADVELVAHSEPSGQWCSRSTGIVACRPCARSWQLTMAMAATNESNARPLSRSDRGSIADRTPIVCGTERGYNRHMGRRKRSDPTHEACAQCKKAHATYVALGRAGQPADPNALYGLEQQAALFDEATT